jgi:predicted SnoaL-like aldol condensation-catalyzing enzyme
MSLEKNKAMIRKGVEEVNKRNIAVLDEFIAPDYVDHTNPLRGLEDVKQFYTKAFKDFPDYHRTIEDIIAEGDKVWVRYKITATDPTDKKMELAQVAIYRIVNGKIVEGWSVPQVVSKEKKLKVA